VGLPMIVGYIIGGPLLVLYLLYSARAELLKPFDQINKSVVRKYHFLFKGYEPQYYFWELVVMVRKVGMVFIAVFLEWDFQLQSLMATLLCVISVVVHGVACPYMTDSLDSLELMSLFGSFCTYFLGQFLFVDTIAEVWKTLVSVVIGLINVFIMVSFVLIIVGMASATLKTMILNLQCVRWCCPKNKQRFENVKELDPNSLIGVDKVPLPRVLYPSKISVPECKDNDEIKKTVD